MPIPCDRIQREHDSWVECPEGSNLPARRVKVCSSGSDPVFVTFTTPGQTKIIADDHAGVTAGTEQIVVTYTVPAGKSFFLNEVAGSSCNWTKFWVEIDGARVKTKRTYTADFNADFEFFGLELTEGQTVRLKGVHNRTNNADVEGSIIGSEV